METSKFLIGFATQYYTFWHYTSKPLFIATLDGKTHKAGAIESFTYYQNLSKELDIAKKKYIEKTGIENPDWSSLIDESLRGVTTSFKRRVEENLPDEYFPKGRYYGSLISECTDYSYLFWAYNNILSEKGKEIALPILEKNDYTLHKHLDGTFELMEREESTRIRINNEKSQYIESLRKGFLLTNGEKVSLNGTCIDKYSRNGYYGTTYTYLFDVEGMLLRYEGGVEYDGIRVGENYNISGTIKHHSYWSDLHEKQVEYTKILRMKVKNLSEEVVL